MGKATGRREVTWSKEGSLSSFGQQSDSNTDSDGGGCSAADKKANSSDEQVGNAMSISVFHRERYGRFLSAYFGFTDEARRTHVYEASRLSMIGVRIPRGCWRSSKHSRFVVAAMPRLRHSVLAVEGDASFHKVVAEALCRWRKREDTAVVDNPCEWPNARCIALHYGIQQPASYQQESFPRATLLAIVASTGIAKGDAVRLCLRSYYRCLDEAAWYDRTFGHRHVDELNPTESVANGVKQFPAWPKGLPFYHGVGSAHAGTKAVASFPFTLLDMKEAPELGKGQYGIFAAQPIPYATCFLYGGPAVSAEVADACQKVGVTGGDTSSPSLPVSRGLTGAHNDKDIQVIPSGLSSNCATYALGLGQHSVCFGQGLMRYANHRYNLCRFGNIELCSLVLMVASDLSPLRRGTGTNSNKKTSRSEEEPMQDFKGAQGQSPPSSHRKRKNGGENSKGSRLLLGRHFLLEKESHLVTIPFFITTTDIEPGEQLLAWSYGEEYDAQLERKVVCDGHIVPYAAAAVLNSRQPFGRWQPYGGDYRHGVVVGDVVWCSQLSLGGGRDLMDSLAVVLEVPQKGAGYMLLRPVTRSMNQKSLLADFPCPTGGEWVVFDVYDVKDIEHCLCAHVDTIGLLIADEDYLVCVPVKSNLSQNRKCGGGRSSPAQYIAIDAVHLRKVTKLVMDSDVVKEDEKPLLRGEVWFVSGVELPSAVGANRKRPCHAMYNC